MKVLVIGSDRKVFEEGSAVRQRLIEYGKLVEELHVIVFSSKSHKFESVKFAHNIFLYPTDSVSKIMYIFDALRIVSKLNNNDIKIDIVSAQDPFEAGLVAFLAARMLSSKLHLQIHTDIFSPYFAKESLLNFIRVIFARFLLKQANAVRVVSLKIENKLRVILGKTPVMLLPIYIDKQRYKNTKVEISLKKKYPQFRKHILMASRFSKEKNIELAINAMRGVVAKHPDVGLIIVGEGKREVELKSLVKKNSLFKNICFEKWSNDLISYYKTTDLFVLSSNYEGYGMTVVEAVLCECPVVMTDVGCAGTIVTNGINGLVVAVGDEKALTRAINRSLFGSASFKKKLPELLSKSEYLEAYKKSWEDAL